VKFKLGSAKPRLLNVLVHFMGLDRSLHPVVVTNPKNGTTLVHEDVAEAILEEVHMAIGGMIPMAISESAGLGTLDEDVLTFTDISNVSHVDLIAYMLDLINLQENVNWLK